LSGIDKNGDDTIKYEDFFEIMIGEMLERDPIEKMKKAFHLI
jgi:centrin-3